MKEKSHLEGVVKILKEKNDDTIVVRVRVMRISKEWPYKTGEENKKLIANLETCHQESKNNYVQGNLWQNNSKWCCTYISDLHASLGPILERSEAQSLKTGYCTDLKELGEANRAKLATRKKQDLATRA